MVHVLSVDIDADDSVSTALSRLGSSQTSMYELPTCPVCLERMDSAITGLITVPCSHTFHCTCLSKWGDSRSVLAVKDSSYMAMLNPASFIDAPSADIRKPSCHRILLHQLPPLFPCPSPIPPHRPSQFVAPVRQLRTSGFVLSAAISVVAATVGLMRTHTIRLPLIFTRWSSKHNVYGIMRVMVTCIA